MNRFKQNIEASESGETEDKANTLNEEASKE